MIDRGFTRIAGRLVHHRQAGPDGPPLVMLHASPGSSAQLRPMIEALAALRPVIAPDTPGNGDSEPLERPQPEMADYAAALGDWLDARAMDRADLYGSHTGANIAVAFAIANPDRVRRLVIDGMALYTDAQRDLFLAHYAPEIAADPHGAHFLWAFHFCRDQYLWFPWFARDRSHARTPELPDPAAISAWALEVLKALPTYHLGYRAAFRFDKRAALPRVAVPTLVCHAPDDPLARDAAEVAALVPGAVTGPATPEAIDAFLRTP